MCICISVPIYTDCTYILIDIFSCTYAQNSLYTYTPVHAYIYIYIYVCVYVCVCVCVCVSTYIYIILGDIYGIMVTPTRNEHADLSSNHGQDCLYFTARQYP